MFKEKILRSTPKRRLIGMQYMRSLYQLVEWDKSNDRLNREMRILGFELEEDKLINFKSIIDNIFDLTKDYTSEEEFMIIVKLAIINAVGKLYPTQLLESGQITPDEHSPSVHRDAEDEDSIENYQNITERHKQMIRESYIFAFTRLLHLTKLSPKFQDRFLVEALMEHLFIVAKICLDNETLTVQIVHCLMKNLLTEHMIKDFERITGLLITALFRYPMSGNIRDSFMEFLEFIIKKRHDGLENKFSKIQFIFLSEVKKLGDTDIIKRIKTIYKSVYKNEDTTENALMSLANSIDERNNEDLLLLNIRYINQVIEEYSSDVCKVLMKPHVRDYVYSRIVNIKD